MKLQYSLMHFDLCYLQFRNVQSATSSTCFGALLFCLMFNEFEHFFLNLYNTDVNYYADSIHAEVSVHEVTYAIAETETLEDEK